MFQKKRSIVFVLSDFMDSNYEAALRIAGKRHDLIGVVLQDPRENELPNVGLMHLRDAESGASRLSGHFQCTKSDFFISNWVNGHRKHASRCLLNHD